MIDDYVKLEPESHVYTDRDGGVYKSVSKFLDMFCKKFDVAVVSRATAKSRGVPVEEVLAEWDKKRDDSVVHGNRIHTALERYEKEGMIWESDFDLADMIRSVAGEYKGYNKVYQEVLLYNKEYMIAGTSDKLLVCTSHPNSVCDFAIIRQI